ncbi:hypothetical protein BDN71DRAFT_114330 [Pleurotus eryngii]|uniref:Uncharacterized protein n=1 Tax=Pleurotus eryngii TaxID=5323 RepID=A0A9P5ZNC4_PLEER|nr:hypothetical protein BDN71DRAFT_114330 [Pleurotus eryngii]
MILTGYFDTLSSTRTAIACHREPSGHSNIQHTEGFAISFPATWLMYDEATNTARSCSPHCNIVTTLTSMSRSRQLALRCPSNRLVQKKRRRVPRGTINGSQKPYSLQGYDQPIRLSPC